MTLLNLAKELTTLASQHNPHIHPADFLKEFSISMNDGWCGLVEACVSYYETDFLSNLAKCMATGDCQCPVTLRLANSYGDLYEIQRTCSEFEEPHHGTTYEFYRKDTI